MRKPYLFLNHEPGRTGEIIGMVQDLEQRGFPGIFSSGTPGDNIALSLLLLERTSNITVGTGIAGIYHRHAHTMATGAALVEEAHPGRFILGLGVTHAPWLEEMGLTFGRPLSDMRSFVQAVRAETAGGACPPVVIGALRQRMTALAGAVADGVMWANAARSHLPESMRVLPDGLAPGFILSNSAPVCVHDDRDLARDAIRRYLLFYMKLEHYQNYWVEAGYTAAVDQARRAIAAGDERAVLDSIPDELVEDTGVLGSPEEVQRHVETWQSEGITHLVLDPVSATSDDALVATREVFAAFE